MILTLKLILINLLFISSFLLFEVHASKRPLFINVTASTCFNESCYTDIADVANSPLVECEYLPEQFYECENEKKNFTTNCTRLTASKYSDLQTIKVQCRIFDYIECRGKRIFYMEVPCIKYTDKYFVSTLLYSIFLGLFAVDRCCIGHTGIGIGKLITLGGFGIWYMIDIILLILGVIKPADNSTWIPFF